MPVDFKFEGADSIASSPAPHLLLELASALHPASGLTRRALSQAVKYCSPVPPPPCLMARTKLLFLDFDGVLHSTAATAHSPLCLAPQLDQALGEAQCSIDISSSWRFQEPLAALKSKLPPGLARRVIGATGTAHIGAYAASGKQQREAAVYGTLSLAEKIGRAIREARAAHVDVIKAIQAVTGAFVIFHGKLLDVQRRDLELVRAHKGERVQKEDILDRVTQFRPEMVKATEVVRLPSQLHQQLSFSTAQLQAEHTAGLAKESRPVSLSLYVPSDREWHFDNLREVLNVELSRSQSGDRRPEIERSHQADDITRDH